MPKLRFSRWNPSHFDLKDGGSIPAPDGSEKRKYQNTVSYQPAGELKYAKNYRMSVLARGRLRKGGDGDKKVYSSVSRHLQEIFRRFLILLFW
jgi:hypothetical protein